MRRVGQSNAGRRQARRRDGNDLSQAASDPGSRGTQQCIQVGHNFIPGAFTQAVGPEIKRRLAEGMGSPRPGVEIATKIAIH